MEAKEEDRIGRNAELCANKQKNFFLRAPNKLVAYKDTRPTPYNVDIIFHESKS